MVGQGQWADAESLLRSASEGRPSDVRLAFELGALQHEADKRTDAELAYGRALAADPLHPGAMLNLASLLVDSGRHQEAERILTPALTRPTKALSAAMELLLALRSQYGGDLLPVWAALADTDPSRSDAWTQLAAAARGHRPDEALRCFINAVAAAPYDCQMHCNLGIGYMDLGRLAEATDAFVNALALDPENADALGKLAMALDAANTSQNLDRVQQCIGLYLRALELEPDSTTTLFNLASAYKRGGMIEEARDCCRRAEAIEGPSGYGLRALMLAPRVYPSVQAMLEYRGNLEDGLDRLRAEGVVIRDPLATVGETGFGLGYHNFNDVEIQQHLARFYLDSVPGLDAVAPHCARPRRRGKGQKIRLGVVGSYLHNRTLDNLNEGLIRNLSRDRFELVFFRPGGVADSRSDAMDQLADKVRYLSNNLDGARQAVMEEELDALFYFEIGMVGLTYFLAFSRLAPVQCVTWGHPDTTGIPNMDYFLSSSLLEPDGAEAHYSETLIRLAHLPTCYPRPPVDEAPGDRTRLGLPDDAHIYVCPQNLMKFHPDFDVAVARILTQDPDGWLYITTSAMEAWRPALQLRLAKACGEAVAQRIVFLPQMSRLDFMSLLKVADVNLDPFHFSGGNSTHEALALGSPVVTLPGDYMRGRVSLGLYRRMGFEDLVARDVDDYVDKALRLARDADWRESVRATIRERSVILFDNVAMVREFEDFIAAAVDAAQRGETLTAWTPAN
ncbi:hypothetical protein A6A04_12140 [Paramagnetospirillum marisnigri]|uniref:protein O-GlcNAc transferase n=1 Tax=Paramagnetospirillum marisnigri TaxID=1285242 RepID=A0A178MWN5_9PROT|nr:hypothetical protein A6A04_12140 [Paramagnetospirillum marisnigri]